MSKLPTDWTVAKLGDVLQLKYGKSLPAKARVDGDVPVFGSNGAVGTHNRALAKGPVIVVGRKGSVGEVNYSESACWPIDTTYFVDEFREHEPRFWYHALRYLNLGSLDRATAIPGLNREDAYDLSVPVPPPQEQKRIADKLDRLFAAVEDCKSRLDAIPGILKRFRQSVLAAAVSGELTEEWRRQMGCTERWQTYSLKDLCSRVSVGHVGETSKYYTTRDEGGIPFLRSQNVRPGRISLEGLNYITKEFHAQLKKSQLHAGDLLVVRVGANRGDACVLPPGFGEINCANIVFARPKAILPQYLNVFVQSPTCRDDLIGRTVGGAQGVINTRSVEMIQIKVPSEAEQIEIVRRVDELLAYCERVQATTAAVRVRVDILVQALLSKAFRGQLGEVPTEKQNTAGDRSLIYVDHEGRMLLGV